VLINLNETEVKFALYAVREMAVKLESKFSAPVGQQNLSTTVTPTFNPISITAGTVRLTKAGRPAKKPGRKPGKKPVVKIVTPVEQAA
jgi:hypothetical protein